MSIKGAVKQLGFAGVLPLLVLGFFTTVGQAQPVLCVETDSGATAGTRANGLQQGGCVTDFTSLFDFDLWIMASDGEVAFRPTFSDGVTPPFDISDGIDLHPFAQTLHNNGFTGEWVYSGPPGWVLIAPDVWVLPEPELPVDLSSEPIGIWTWVGDHAPGTLTGTFLMLEQDGSISDIITAGDDQIGNQFVSFQSGVAVPEPLSLLLLGFGLAGLAVVRKRRS